MSALAELSRRAALAASPELTIVVPCYNERPNIAPLVTKLDAALTGLDWEVLFVDDDSPDGTAAEARRLAAGDPRVRCIRRIGRRGLASAVIEGGLASSARFLAVMDGDLQHDESRLPVMLAALRDGADLAGPAGTSPGATLPGSGRTGAAGCPMRASASHSGCCRCGCRTR